jgi:hypothetical protein
MQQPARRVLPQLGPMILLAFAVNPAGLSQSRSVLKAEPGPRTSPPILQLRSGSNIAGFLPARAYLIAGGHALTVEFLGTPGVMPRIQEKPDPFAVSARKVLYEDLWPGVSLTFSQIPKGNCDTTYILAPGAEAAKIRLRYNVPVRLQKDGTLKFHFSSGSVTESSPEAWQQIDGRRKAVAVSFAISNGEVGFNVGNYDHSIPLTIDPAYRIAKASVSRFALWPAERHFARSTPLPKNNHERLEPTDEQPK